MSLCLNQNSRFIRGGLNTKNMSPLYQYPYDCMEPIQSLLERCPTSPGLCVGLCHHVLQRRSLLFYEGEEGRNLFHTSDYCIKVRETGVALRVVESVCKPVLESTTWVLWLSDVL